MPVFADLLPEPTVLPLESIDPSSLVKLWLLNWLSKSNLIIYLILVLFWIVCMWIIFKKAGRKWRESIIPFWNSFVTFKIVWKPNRFWFLLIPWLVQWFVMWLFNGLGMGWSQVINIVSIICWLFALVWLILFVIMLFKLAKKFGKSWRFGLWLLFLSPIFFWILAFWKAEYHK